MINNLESLYGLIGFIFLFSFIGIVFVNIITRKYNDKLHNLYSLFIDISKRSIFMETIFLLCFAILFYYSIYNDDYGNVPIYLIGILTIISSFIAFNFRMIIANIVYGAVSCCLLWLLDLLNKYLSYVIYSMDVVILKILFVVMVILFAILMLVRQTELLMENNRRNA